MGNDGLIVVGVDGSEDARAALEFAIARAVPRRVRVRAVIAFHLPDSWPLVYGMAAGMVVPPSKEELRRAADQTIRQMVAEVVADAGTAVGAVPLEVRVVEGRPAHVLLDEAADADLLVVGHRGRGGFASVCLGSVGLQCVLHATCPVTVVRPTAPADAELAPASTAPGGRGVSRGDGKRGS